MRPEEPKAVPLYHAARLEWDFRFRDLAELLIAEHSEHVNSTGGYERIPMRAACARSVSRTYENFVVINRAWRRCGMLRQSGKNRTASNIGECKSRNHDDLLIY